MKRNFTSRSIQINIARGYENTLQLSIGSDYSNSQHKGRIYPDKNRLTATVESLWKSIKTKKLLKMGVSFGEIDWYTNYADIYTTPVVHIQRGQKKSRIEEQEHGSIPKDWSFHLSAMFADTTTVTPILEVVKSTLGSFFTPKMEKEFKKVMKPVLQKKTMYCNVYGEDDN